LQRDLAGVKSRGRLCPVERKDKREGKGRKFDETGLLSEVLERAHGQSCGNIWKGDQQGVVSRTAAGVVSVTANRDTEGGGMPGRRARELEEKT